MNIDFKNPRTIGITAAVLLALTTLLPWFSISMPLVGSISANGFTDDEGLRPDGFVALALAAGLALAAWKGKTLATAILSGAFVLGFIGEYAYAMTALADAKSEMGNDEFSKGFADAISLSPGFGLILGTLVAAGLGVHAVLTLRAAKAPEVVDSTPQPDQPEWVNGHVATES